MRNFRTSTSAVICLMFLCSLQAHAQIKASLTRKWETQPGLNTTESVLYDNSRSVLYVSNINGKPGKHDGKGFISILNLDGTFKTLQWATGLDAPKGMGLVKDRLYVADVTNVDVIDVNSGKLEKRIPVPGAVFLNDITVDRTGNVFVSDTKTGKIHKITGDQPSTFYQGDPLKAPNGLLSFYGKFYVLDTQTGDMYLLDEKNKLTKFASIAPGVDGLVADGSGNFLASNWNGEVYFVNALGQSQKILDTKDKKINSADIELFRREKILYVPTFYGNSVVAYDLKIE